MSRSNRPSPILYEYAQVRLAPVRKRSKSAPQDGRWYWQARRTSRGKEVVPWPRGVSRWLTREEALEQLEGQFDRVEPVTPGAATVRDVLEWHKAHKLATSWKGNERAASVGGLHMRHVNEALGTVRVVDLCQRHYNDYVRDRPVAPQTASLELGRLNSAVRWCVEQGFCHRKDPLPKVTRRIERVRESWAPTPDQLDRLGRALWRLSARCRPPRWPFRFFLVQRHTGMRPGEVGPLTWREVDLEARLLRIKVSKTGPREIPINADLEKLLRSWPDDAAPKLFPLSKPEQRVGRWYSRAADSVGLPHLWPHCIRHAVCTELANKGIPPHVAASITGHSVEIFLKVYCHARPADMLAAVEMLRRPGGHLTLVGGEG